MPLRNKYWSFFAVMLLAMVCSLSVSAATGSITFLRFEHNKIVDGVKCLSMHFKVNAKGMKGRQVKVVTYVEHPKGTGVPDLNSRYYTTDGKVSASGTGNATYDDSLWSDFVVNLPNDEIHPLSGNRTYYIKAVLWDGNNVLASTYCDTFNMTGSSANNNNNRPAQNNGSAHQHSGGNDVVNTYRQNLSYGYKIVQEYRNGSRIESTYSPCTMCAGTQRCGICHGNGGIVTAGYGRYIPCQACGQTGVCSLCKANNGYVLTHSQLYDANGNPVYVPPVGGGSYYGGGGSSGGSGSGSGSSSGSSRYGTYDCPTCHGTGTCQTCGGDGIADSYYTGGSMVCPNCSSNRGKCSVCNGTGKKYGVVR